MPVSDDYIDYVRDLLAEFEPLRINLNRVVEPVRRWFFSANLVPTTPPLG